MATIKEQLDKLDALRGVIAQNINTTAAKVGGTVSASATDTFNVLAEKILQIAPAVKQWYTLLDTQKNLSSSGISFENQQGATQVKIDYEFSIRLYPSEYDGCGELWQCACNATSGGRKTLTINVGNTANIDVSCGCNIFSELTGESFYRTETDTNKISVALTGTTLTIKPTRNTTVYKIEVLK